MKVRSHEVALTAMAPALWGSTYIVATHFLPNFPPMTVAMLRALPAGLILLLIGGQLPYGKWWGRIWVLGALNFSFFWSMLFISAYRLPGGVAATIGAIQPLIVIFLAVPLLGHAVRWMLVASALVGIIGVALMVLNSDARLDLVGITAGLAGAFSMALGTVLTRKWQPEVSPLTFTAWQLAAGGLMLVPIVALFEPSLPTPDLLNIFGLVWLGGIGGALTYFLWFRGVSQLHPALVSSLGFLSPVTAIMLGWVFLQQSLAVAQITGFLLVAGSIWLVQWAATAQ